MHKTGVEHRTAPGSTSASASATWTRISRGESIPLACQDWASTKAAYRFFSNERVHELIAAHVLAAQRVHDDDTPVPVLAKDKTDTARAWVYVRDDAPFAGGESAHHMALSPMRAITFARSRNLAPPQHLGEAVELLARLGGWLGRTRDPPGAQLLWHGYTQLMAMTFAFELRDEYG